MTIDVVNALKALSIKPGLSNEKIRHRGFAEEGNYLLPPHAGGDVGICRNEVTGRASLIWCTVKTRFSDLLGIKP